ncbi:hypothetical protein PoMZ_10110, partial [Pyricularia oryzae]
PPPPLAILQKRFLVLVLCQSCLYPILDRRQPSQRVRAMAPTGRMAHVNLSRWCAPRIFLSFYSTSRLTFFCFLVLPLENAKLYEIYLMCYQKWACRHYKKLSSTYERKQVLECDLGSVRPGYDTLFCKTSRRGHTKNPWAFSL